jgi:antitoxin (DNA-binding transcriptional repressor) of toxin-antitoxin stability system
MRAINMLEAKTSLSRLVAVIEDGSEEEIVIARGGRPVARLVLLQKKEDRYPAGSRRWKVRSAGRHRRL